MAASPDAPGGTGRVGLPRSFWLLVAGSGGMFASIGMATFLIPHTAVGRYGADLAEVGVLVACFLIASTLARPLCAEVAGAVGHRRLLGTAIVVYVASLVVVPLVRDLTSAMVLRSISGAAQGCVYLLVLAAIVRVAPPERVGRALSLSSLSVFVGLACSPALAEVVWRFAGVTAAWIATAGVVVLTAPLAWWALPEPGGLVSSGAAGRGPGWRVIVVPGALLALGSIAYGAFQTLIPLYAPTLTDHPVSVLFFTVSGTVVLTQAVMSTLIDRIAPMVLAGASILLACVCMALLAVTASFTGLVASAAALGAATALLFPTVTTWALARLPARSHIRAMALLSPTFEIGQGTGAIVGSRIAGQAGYATAFGSCAAVSASGVLLALVLHRRSRRA